MKSGNLPSKKLPALTPMLIVRNAGNAIEWYKNVQQAKEHPDHNKAVKAEEMQKQMDAMRNKE